MNHSYNPNGKGSSKKRKQFSADFNDHVPNRYNNSSPLREDTMPGNQYRGHSPPRGAHAFVFNSDRPGVGRRRESRSPHVRSPRDRSRELEREHDRFNDRDRGPRPFAESNYRPDHSDRGSARNSSPIRSAQPGGKSTHYPHRSFLIHS